MTPGKSRTQASFVLSVSAGMIRPGTDESGVGDVSIADAAVHCLTHVFV